MKSVLLKIAGVAVVSVLLGASCPPRDYYLIAGDNPFVLETKEATNVGGDEAILNAYFDITGIRYQKLTYGFYWGTSQDSMDTEVECTEVTDGYVVKLSYSTQLTDLEPSTRYWFRSFVMFGSRIFYGETKSFTTSEFKMIAVDLGLSVKWASCNLGATRPTDYGDYYAWGEVEPKRDYSWKTYKWCKGSEDSLTKYCTYYDYWGGGGMPDGKTSLDLYDDVAHIKLGGKWRMPTDKEWTELLERCKWTWTSTNGVNGYKVTGPSGNSIFLPAAGGRAGLDGAGSYGYYWSSSLDTDYPNFAWYFLFDSDNYVDRICFDRYFGWSVRPVEAPWVVPQSVSLDKTSIAFAIGNTMTLNATVLPADATDKSLSWTSTNAAVARVDDNGTVTAVSKGSATIKATANDGSGVSAECSVFVTGFGAVDLGLSIKWANTNIGASKPEEYGDYYAWGETETKTNYRWSTYKWCKGDYDKLTKYCPSDRSSYWAGYGSPDGKTSLELSDDVAHIKLGGKWRIPTDEEWTELRERCKWTWTRTNSVNGYKVTGPSGSSIFLPAAGLRVGTDLNNAGFYGYYWSSSLTTGTPYRAWSVYFNSDDGHRNDIYRFYGLSVRPVSE